MAGISVEHDDLRLLNLSQYNVTLDDLQLALNLSAQAEMADCYCSSRVREISAAYRSIHGYVALAVCTLGILANAINLAVLTRPALATAPVNRLLTGLAAADMLVMAEYAPFAAYLYLRPPRSLFSVAGANFLLFHMHFSQLLHTASICLTLSLAAWRYIAVRYPQLAPRLCTDSRCWMALLLSLLTPLPLCAPSLLVFSVHETRVRVDEDGGHVSHFHVDLSESARRQNELLYEVNLWLHAVVVKLLPCVILTVISISLMRTLYTAKQRKKQLSERGGAPAPVKLNPVQHHGGSARRSRAEKRADRTTRMLLAVLLLFLATESPQGVLGLMSGILGRCFFRRCYQLFGEALDILALLNGSINFILYCAMSRQYRQTFRQLFCWPWWPRCSRLPAAPAAAVSAIRSAVPNGTAPPARLPASINGLTAGPARPVRPAGTSGTAGTTAVSTAL